MSGEHVSRYSEKFNLAEHREKIGERRKKHAQQYYSLPPKYRSVNTAPIIDLYSRASVNVKNPYRSESHSQNRLNLNEVQLSLNLLQLDPVDRIVLRVADERDAMQKRTFENWINCHLMKIGKRVDDIFSDLRDGILLLNLLEVLSNQKMLIQGAFSRFHCLENINTVLNFLRSQNIKLVNIHADDLVDGNPKLTLGLVWIIILFYQFKDIVQSSKSDDLSVKQILLQWSRKALEDYSDINIENFSSSWKDGKAFLALIHKRRPDLIDFKSITNNTAEQNLEMAFNTAEKELGIPKIIDPEDVTRGNIDEKSMMTYVASLFELSPTGDDDDDVEQKIYNFQDQYNELLRNLNLAIEELNDYYDRNDFNIDFIQNRLENNFSTYSKQYEIFCHLYEDISKTHSSNDLQKKFHTISTLWSKFETNSKEKSLILTNESKKVQRSEKISRSLDIECTTLGNSVEEIKSKIRKISPLKLKTSVKEQNEYYASISKEIYDCENQINNMIISVQELKRDGYPADQHYRRIININGIIDKVKKEFEKLCPSAMNSGFTSRRQYTPVHSMNLEDNICISNLDKWRNWIDEKNILINEINFNNDLNDLNRNYQEFTKLFDEIKNSVDEFKAVLESDNQYQTSTDQSKNQLKAKFNDLWTICSVIDGDFKSLNEFMVKSNESINWIKTKEDQQIHWQWFDTQSIKLSEKQEKFKNLIDELEMKETSINETIAVGTTLAINNHSANSFIQKSLITLKNEWQWILNLTHCLKTHLESLAIYEQFFYEAEETDNAILELTNQLDSRFFRPMGVGLDEGEILNREIRDMLDTIEVYKESVNRIIGISQNVSALSLRTTSILPDKRINIKAICSSKENPDSYTRQFNEGECLQLINNFGNDTWKIANSKNEIFTAPAICFLITDMSPQASQTAVTLDTHWNFLKDLWTKRELQLREQVLYSTMNVVINWTPEDFVSLEPSSRQKIVEILNQDANRLLLDLKCARIDDKEINKFQVALNECNARFAELAHSATFSVQVRNENNQLSSPIIKSINRDSFTSVDMQLDDLLSAFVKMKQELSKKLASHVVLDVDLLEEQVCKHKEFETNLKNYEMQVNDLITFVKNGMAETEMLKPKLEKMIDLWEQLWNEAHMFVIKLKSTEVFFSQLDEIDQVICEIELTLINQNECFPAGMDQIKILIAQLEAAEDSISSVLGNLTEVPVNLEQLINAVTAGRYNQNDVSYEDIQKLKKELKSIEYRYELLKNQIKKRLNHVNECSSQYQLLKNELKTIQTWIIGLQTNVKSQINIQTNALETKNIDSLIKKIKNFQSEIVSYKPEIDEINKSATYFLNLLQKYEDIFKNYQNEIQNQIGGNNQDYYGYNKRSRIQNARDWVTSEIKKLNIDYNNLSDLLSNKLTECQQNLSVETKCELSKPSKKSQKINTFQTENIEINKFREMSEADESPAFSYKISTKQSTENDTIEIISNLNRCQLSNLWYFSNLLSETLAPISVGDCFRCRIIKFNSNSPTTNFDDEQVLTIDEAMRGNSIKRKTYSILTEPRVFKKTESINIMEMLKLNIFNIFNGTFNIDCFSEPLTISKAVNSQIIDKKLGGYLNCLMISSIELLHTPPTIISAIYTAKELKTSPPLLSLSDSIDLNLFNPISDKQVRFLDPISKTDLKYSDAIRLQYINDDISEILYIDSSNDIYHLTTKEAVKNKIFDAESGNIFAHNFNMAIPLHYARQDGIISKPNSILQIVLEKDESSFLEDLFNRKSSISEALVKGTIDGNSEFSIKPNFSQRISLFEAVQRGIVTESGEVIVEKSNNKFSFLEAFNKGIIKLNENLISGLTRDILHPNLVEKLSLPDAINSGIIDPENEKFFNSLTNQHYTLQEACSNKFISKSLLKDLTVFCGIRNQRNKKLNLLQAINQKLIDLKTGEIRNPLNNKLISINEAYYEKILSENQYNRIVFLTCPLIKFSITIDEIAVNIDQTECKLFENRKLYKTITGVYDSKRDEYISLEEARKRNFIDDDMGTYYHEKENIYYSFTDAIDENLIQTNNEKNKEKIVEIKTIKSEKITSYSISSVFNSITKNWVSAREAVEDGIIDHLSGNYKIINEYGFEIDIPINEAITSGYIEVIDEEEKSINNEFKIIGIKDPMSEEIFSPIDAINKGLVDRKFEKFYDNKCNEILTINQAADLGYVITEKLTINELITRGLIDFDSGMILFPENEIPMSLEKAISSGQIDIDKSMVRHPDNGRHICLREAIECGLFDPIRCEIKDEYGNIFTFNDAVFEDLFPEYLPTLKGKITFEEALEQGYINLKTNTFCDPRNDLVYQVEEAIEKNIIDHPQSNLTVYMTDTVSTVEKKTLQLPNESDFVDTKMTKTSESIKRNYTGEDFDCNLIKTVRDTLLNQDISLSAAIGRGIIKIDDKCFIDKKSGNILTIESACQLGLISVNNVPDESTISNVTSLTGSTNDNNNNNVGNRFYVIDPNSGKKLNFEEAIKENIYDPDEKMIRSTTNNNGYSWDESVKMGFIVSETENELSEDEKVIERNCIVYNYYYVHKGVGVTAKLTNQMISENQIDPINQIIKDPQTGKSVTLVNGLENGSVFATIITQTNKSLYFENLNQRHDNYQIISVYDPSINQLISSRDAIDKKLINIIDSTYVNQKSNETSTLSDALQHGLLHTIMKTRQYLPLSYPFTNVHIRTIEEEMNFSIPQTMPEGLLNIVQQKPKDSKKFEELSNIIPISVKQEHEKPVRKYSEENLSELSQIDAPNVAMRYTADIKNELVNLKTIEEKLLKETTVFLSEKENQLLIDEFQDINNEFTAKKDPILSLVHKVEKFLVRNSDNIPMEVEKNLLAITNNLKVRTNQTQKEIDNRSRLLFGINDESVQFFNKLNDCNINREKLENSIQITSNIESCDNLEKAIVDLKLLDSEFVSYHNDIRVLTGFKIKFVDKITKLEEYRKKFSEFLDIPIESPNRLKTEQEVNDLTNEVMEGQKFVHDLYKSKLSQLKDAFETFENLKDNQRNVDEIIRSATEELNKISFSTENLSVHLLIPYTNDLHRLNGEITGISRIIKEIENILPITINCLETVGVTKSNSNSIRKSIDVSNNNFTTITKRLHNLLQEINKQSISDKDTVDSVNNLDHWINEIDHRIKSIGSLSLDQKVLSEQERLIQTIHVEIDGRHPVLENIWKNVDSSNKLEVENLEKRVKEKLLAASNIINSINNLRKLLDDFNSMVKSCSEWVITATEFLTDRMFTRLDNENFGEKLSEIKNEYKIKQNIIEQGRQLSIELLRQENCKDRSCIEISIENLEKVWLSLEDLIKTRSKELINRENYFGKYSELKDRIVNKLNNWEQTVSMNSPLAIDLSTLQKQYESIDNFIKEWNSSKAEINEFCIVGSEYDSILQGFPLGGDQQFKVTSPQRRPSKIKPGLHIQSISPSGATKPVINQPSGHYSGSESSGVSSADYVNLNQEFSEVILEIDDIKSRYSEIGDQFLNRKTDISELLKKCKLFEKDYNEFLVKLDNQLIQLISVEAENLNKNDEIAQYEKLEEDIKGLRPELMNILFAGQDLIRHRELVPGGVEIRSNLDELEKKFNSLKDTSKKQLNLRRNIDSQLKKFQDMKKSIENSIMRKERMLNVLGPVGTSVSYGNAQLQQVNALIDEVEGLEYDLKELNDVGKDIIRGMSPTASEVDEIESTLDTLSKKVDNLNKLLKDRESNINAVMGPSKDFYKLINSVIDRLALLQEKIDRNDVNVLTSFDWEEIQTELDSIKALLHDCENLSKTLLESISDENTHYEIKNKINNLSRHCREIQWKIDHSVNMIGKRSQQEDNILNKIEDAEKWITQKQALAKSLSLESKEIPGNLSDNIRQLQIFQGDIKHKNSQLNDLYTEINRINEEKSPTHKSKQIYEKLEYLLDVIGKIESDINILTDVYQQASVDLSKINNETNKIEAWIDIEKHKINKQYPIGFESIEAEIKLLEATIRSIENKNQQLHDLKNIITLPNNVNSTVILTRNLSSLNQIETDLNNLQLEAQDKLELLRNIQEQISSTSDNLNYIKTSLLKLETKGSEYSKIEESIEKPVDVSKLESEIKSIQSDMHLIKPDMENTKSIISSIAQISPVNATLLEPEMDKISNRYQILSSSLSQKLIFLNSKHKAMNECKNRIEIFATRQKNLKEKIDNFPQSSLDLDSLEDQIQDLNSLNREANEMENSLLNLKSEVNNLADHNIESAEKSKQKIDLLNSNNEQIKELIDDRQNSLILQHKIVTEFETKKNDFNRKMDEANNDPELGKLMNNNSKNISSFTKQKIEPLKKQLEEVINIGNNACSTVISGLGYKHIEQEMDSVKHNFDKLMQIVSDIENHVDIKLMKEQKFDASLKNLKEFVMNISKDLNSEEEPSIEYHKSKSQLNSHRLLLDRLKKRRSSLDELNKIGADLLLTMKEPKKSQLESDLDDLNRKYENLLNVAEEKNCRYDRAVKLSKSFKDFYEPSLVWLDTAEKNLANFDTSPTVDTIEMDKRIQEYKNLVKEIKSHEETLKNLNQVGEDLMKVSTENDSAAINNKINTLHNYFDEISANALKKLSLFESSIPIAERFLLANNKLDLVLPSLIALVRENDSLTGQMGERNMEILENETSSVEKLVSQARNDLNKLKSVDAFENSLEKVEDLFVENEKRFKEVLNKVTRKATKLGSNRTKAKIQEENLEECMEMLSDFEHKINDINDKINNDYSNLEDYKFEFINLLGAWNENKESVNTIINDSKKLIRQAPGSDLKSLRSSIDRVKKQCQTITKTFETQQQKLDEIIPLAKEFTISYNKLKDWLVETEENMYQNKINNLDPDQLHKAEQEIKITSKQVLANSWEDQKPLLDIIIKAGHPLSQTVNRVQGKHILTNIEDAKKRYNNIKDFIKTRATDLEDLISINTELNEKVDQCANQIENIKDRISDCYQPSVHPEKLEEELGIFDEIIYDLEKLQLFVDKLQVGIENCSPNRKKFDDQTDSIELLEKLEKISNSNKELQQQSLEFKDKIKKLLKSSNEFWNDLNNTEEKFNKITVDLTNSTIEDLNARSVNDKKILIENLRSEIDVYDKNIENIIKKGNELIEQVNNPNETPDIEQAEEELKRNFDSVRAACDQQIINIDRQQSLIMKLEDMRIKLDEWFKEQNNRLFILGPLPTETRPVLTQIEKTKELKNEIEPKHRDIEMINQLGYQLTKGSHPNIKNQVNNTLIRINDSWARLLDGLGQRQHQLQCILLSLGEFHRAVDEFIEWIIATEKSLSNIKIEHGDINSLEMGLAQHKMIRADMNISQASVSKIERKAAEIIKEDVTSLGHEAIQRLEQLRTSWEALKEHIRIKHFELEDALKEALIFYGDQQEISKNIDELGSKLEVFKFSGGLPDTAKEQLKRFMDIYRTFPKLNSKIERFVEDSSEISKKSSSSIAKTIEIDTDNILKKWNAVKALAESRKTRLEKAIETVEIFHLDMAKFINWVTLTEKNLNQQRPVSRIVPTILDQIEAHRALKRDIMSHRDEMLNLDKMATHLKYISQKHDIVLIRNLMSSIHHRWEKVVSRSSERSRNLDYGYKEAKRFEDMNKALLDDIAQNLAFLEQDTSIGQTPSKIREQIAKHKEFHCNLGVHNLTYDATRRLGYQLRDKAPLQDSKKIDEIVHNLQMKWQNLCNKSIEREKALNDALLVSGNYKDAMNNLLSWLHAIEPTLNDTSKGCGGDINTVKNLLSEHATIEKQLKDRDHMIEKINTDAMTLMIQSEEDSSFIEDQLAELKSLWSNVNNLSTEKRKRLEYAKSQAVEFEFQWNGLKEFFSKAEHDLRQFTISPEEEREDTITTMISNHNSFHKNLLLNENKINDFQQFGHEILASAYPNAEGPIKHYINIIKSQWSELLGWSEQRGQNLKEHLHRLNERKILLDDLLLWLAAAEGTLLASESRESPYTLNEAKFQYDEHERFIADMTLKQKDHDEIVTNSKRKSTIPVLTHDRNKKKELEINSSLNKIQEPIFVNAKVNQLHTKWKQVWFMILNRRKRLLDHLDYLKQVDNMKNFNFDDWRQRYMSWMNHSKSRVMDFFRRQDTDHDGRVTRKEFIDGIIDSKFQTTRVEMEVVADIFDKEKSGFIDYRQFLAALRPDRETYQVKPINENEIIHDEVKKQISKCTCRNPYKITQCGDGKYKFGDTEKLRLVRILRSNVMVRIGGGWCALDEFLVKHDPCRVKGRTNYELREKLSKPEGTVNTMAPFKFKPASLPAPPKKSTSSKVTSPRLPQPVTSPREPQSLTSHRIPQPLASPKIPQPLASPRISQTLTSPRIPKSLSSPRTSKVTPSPGPQRKSRIPTRQTSQQGSQTSTRHQSRDISPESATSPTT